MRAREWSRRLLLRVCWQRGRVFSTSILHSFHGQPAAGLAVSERNRLHEQQRLLHVDALFVNQKKAGRPKTTTICCRLWSSHKPQTSSGSKPPRLSCVQAGPAMPRIHGIGCDAVSISRIARLVERYGERFLKRVYHPSEVAFCLKSSNPSQSLAVRWAAKEAAFKALGLGAQAPRIAFPDIVVCRDARDARPRVALKGPARRRALRAGVGAIHLSLSHERDQAIAFCTVEQRRR
jgi:holo-[acyl-carrier protein] synthase